MKTFSVERIELLRILLKEKNFQACIIPTADPHQSEYTADCWKFREYISGFTGSAGTLVVGASDAGLWVDSRYYIQAEAELSGSNIQLFKVGLPETPEPELWISGKGYESVALDGSVFSVKEVQNYSHYFEEKNIRLNTNFNPYDRIWKNRPSLPEGDIYVFSEEYSGEAVRSKIQRLQREIQKSGADCMPLAALDEIAWLFNLRGNDISYNPVGICFAFIHQKESFLFVNSSKIKSSTKIYLEENGIKTLHYDALPNFLSNLGEKNILIDKTKINYQLFQSISKCCIIKEGLSPISRMKAIKNPVEINGFRKAMIQDGIALVRFWKWMEEAIEKNDSAISSTDEWTFGNKIAKFRTEQKNYIGDSFHPIIAYKEHGAIVHYEASPEGSFIIKSNGILLIDTGGHYLDGTTDITRTWSLYKECPINYQEDYTAVLKGLIALSTSVFPTGTRGTQLDILARQFLWKRNLNFGHGTGHGVGHVLNVHEGPQSIRMNENPTPLEAGMVISNEPGIYRAGKYGIRIENILLVQENETSEYGKFHSFETLTLLPFDLNSIQKDLLDREEIRWINDYHQTVFKKLESGLNNEEQDWLRHKTRKIE